jgi:amino acid transporter
LLDETGGSDLSEPAADKTYNPNRPDVRINEVVRIFALKKGTGFAMLEIIRTLCMIAGFSFLIAFLIILKGVRKHEFLEFIKRVWWIGVIGIVLVIISAILIYIDGRA